MFVVVTLADLAGLVTQRGQEIIDTARHSIDGTKIILDFNHHRATIDGLFNVGVDVDAVLVGCQMLRCEEAKALMIAPSSWLTWAVLRAIRVSITARRFDTRRVISIKF
jgi:hypothetical protein